MKHPFKRAVFALSSLLRIDRHIDEIKLNQGRTLAVLQREQRLPELRDYEFKVFSQWGEDGILQHLTTHLALPDRNFIEFGVEDFLESNCRFLLMKDRWRGFVIDGSADNIERLRGTYFYWQYPLDSVASFITRENVESLVSQSGFGPCPGILSVDIDGVDWWVLQALEGWRPAIIIVEYNGVFGCSIPVTVPYAADFQRSARHRSNLYYGANLPAFDHLLRPRGYSLVGVNGAGSNAFYVRNELLNDRVPAVPLDRCYLDSSFREGRDAEGRLSLLAGAARRSPIAALPLIDVASGASLLVGDIRA